VSTGTPADLLMLHAVRLTASAPVGMPNVSRPRPCLSLENAAHLNVRACRAEDGRSDNAAPEGLRAPRTRSRQGL
jgi:hypothetical protein